MCHPLGMGKRLLAVLSSSTLAMRLPMVAWSRWQRMLSVKLWIFWAI